jgi:hypothetical protein
VLGEVPNAGPALGNINYDCTSETIYIANHEDGRILQMEMDGNSSAGGVDLDFEENGYVWMTGDALDFYTPDVVYGVQGTPYGGGDITNSTLIDHDSEVTQQDKGGLGDCELPIPGDAMPPPPPPEG